MSNALAVATVTQALALLIEHHLRPEIDMAVSVETRKPPADPPTDPTITVFLYQVTHNPSMRNHDIPTRASDGTLVNRSAAAIDLHFLISAYGEEQELVGQRLIGSVVRTLHEMPVLPKDLIEEAAERPYLEGSNLAEAIQKVRFTPTQMDIDEASKLWGMLHQTPYTLSVVYQASLVLLDGHEKPAPATPVRRPEVRTHPFGAPGAPERPVLGETVLPGDVLDGGTKTNGAGGAEGGDAKPAEGKEGTGASGAAARPAKKASGSAKSGAAPARSRTRTRTSTRKATDAEGAGGAERKDDDGKES